MTAEGTHQSFKRKENSVQYIKRLNCGIEAFLFIFFFFLIFFRFFINVYLGMSLKTRASAGEN